MKFRTQLATALLLSTCAIAEANEQEGNNSGWSYVLSLGTANTPKYLGDDEHHVLLIPNVFVSYEDKFFASFVGGAGYNFINRGGLKVGPKIRYDVGRKEDGTYPLSSGDETKDLQGLGDIDGSFELGGFIEYEFSAVTASLEIRKAIEGHKGLIAEAGLELTGLFEVASTTFVYSFEPKAVYTGANYNETYFGIDRSQSVASGLAEYDSNSSGVTFDLNASITALHGNQISTTIFAKYSKLATVIADSSLVQQRGSDTQSTIGLSVNYAFD